MKRGSDSSKKKWYLTDNKHSMENYIGPLKMSSPNVASTSDLNGKRIRLSPIYSNLFSSSEDEEQRSTSPVSNGYREESISQDDPKNNPEVNSPPSMSPPSPGTVVDNEEGSSPKKMKRSYSESVAGSAAHLTSVIDGCSKERKVAIINFFKSILPDVQTLDPKRQRYFRTTVMQFVDRLLERQDNDIKTVTQDSV